MDSITVVIKGATQDIRLGLELAGGRVTSASEGDKIDELEKMMERQRALRESRLETARRSGPITQTAESAQTE